MLSRRWFDLVDRKEDYGITVGGSEKRGGTTDRQCKGQKLRKKEPGAPKYRRVGWTGVHNHFPDDSNSSGADVGNWGTSEERRYL